MTTHAIFFANPTSTWADRVEGNRPMNELMIARAVMRIEQQQEDAKCLESPEAPQRLTLGLRMKLAAAERQTLLRKSYLEIAKGRMAAQ